MKNRLLTGIVFLVLGLFIAIGPQTIISVCSTQAHAESSMHTPNEHTATDTASSVKPPMKCHWTGKAELGVGIVIAVLGVFILLSSNLHLRLGLSVGAGLNAILAISIPTFLIGVCGNVKMQCKSLTFPALLVAGGLVLLVSVINILWLTHSIKEELRRHEHQTSDTVSALDSKSEV
jgi:hypothetical protein